MTRTEAIKRGRKLYGLRFVYRVETVTSSPERRQAAQVAAAAQMAEVARLDAEKKAIDAPFIAAMLEANADVRARLASAKKARDHELWESTRHKFQIGQSGGAFTFIKGSGDTWEEAFKDAESKAGK